MNFQSFKKIFRKFILFLLFSVSFLQSGITVKLEILGLEPLYDKKQNKTILTGYVGETFQVKVKILGSAKKTGNIEVDGLEKLNVEGTSNSTTINILNSKQETEISYIYDVNTEQEGVFEIGPAKIDRNGTEIKSVPEKILFKILKRTGDAGTLNTAQQNKNYDIFSRVEINKDEVFLGEPIILKFKAYSYGDVLQAGFLPVKLEDFSIKETEEIKQSQELINGRNYRVLQKEYILFPTSTGKKEVPSLSAIFQVQVQKNKRRFGNFIDHDDFFQNFFKTSRVETKKIFVDPFTITVKPLPNNKNFNNIDAVGEFSDFIASVDKNEALINEPILFILTLHGKGNLDQILAPKLDLPSFFNIYESKVDVDIDYSKQFSSGTKKFEFVMQINKPGNFEINKQKFTYFDPESETYKTLYTQPISLHIKKPQNMQEESSNNLDLQKKEKEKEEIVEQSESKILDEDIHFIDEDINQITSQKNGYLPWIIFFILILIPISIYGARHFKLLKVFKIGKSKKKTFNQYKKELEKIIKNKEAGKIYTLFLSYLAEKFELSINTINEELIARKLKQHGLSDDKVSNFLTYLNECAGITFAPESTAQDDLQRFLQQSRKWLLIIEKK
ncbi:hypothetical protein GF322_02970 [Candidatus Dependentiae bacterium]|nr:hypothetical protein [Candidatus Dependentiae bacterium]